MFVVGGWDGQYGGRLAGWAVEGKAPTSPPHPQTHPSHHDSLPVNSTKWVNHLLSELVIRSSYFMDLGDWDFVKMNGDPG